jgi:hypothetical protein
MSDTSRKQEIRPARRRPHRRQPARTPAFASRHARPERPQAPTPAAQPQWLEKMGWMKPRFPVPNPAPARATRPGLVFGSAKPTRGRGICYSGFRWQTQIPPTRTQPAPAPPHNTASGEVASSTCLLLGRTGSAASHSTRVCPFFNLHSSFSIRRAACRVSLRVFSGYSLGILRVASGCLPVAYQMAWGYSQGILRVA